MPLSLDKPKRSTANPNPVYDDDPNLKMLREQLEEQAPGNGDLSDVTTDDEQDTTYQGRSAGGDSDGERSDDDSDDPYASDEDNVRRHSRKISPEHRQAIVTFCLFMKIAKSDYAAMRRGIGYVVKAIHHSDKFDEQLRNACRRLQWETPVSEENLTKIIAIAEPIAKSERIAVHCEAIGQAFGKLAEFNGGYFATVSRNIPVLYGIALMAQMVDALPEFLANGSAQETGFAMLLKLHGLQGDAPEMLAQAFSTDTPIDSVRGIAQKLMEDLAAHSEEARLAALLGQLAQFETVGERERAARAATGIKSYYDHKYYDRPRTKNLSAGPKVNKLHRVVVGVVVRRQTLEGKKLAEYTASKGETEEFEYAPFRYLREPLEVAEDVKLMLERKVEIAHPGVMTEFGYETVLPAVRAARQLAYKEELAKWKAEYKRRDIERFGEPQLAFRAETHCKVPGNDVGWDGGLILYDAMRSLLGNPHDGKETLAPKLSAYLDYAYPEYRNSPWGFPLPYAYIGFRKNGRNVRVGRQSPNRRTLAPGVEEATVNGSLPMWIAMNKMTITQFINLIPPWLLHTPGLWEIYLHIDQETAPGLVFNHPRICRKHRQAFNAKNEAILKRARKEAEKLSDECFKYALMQHTFTEDMDRPKRKLKLTLEEENEMDSWAAGWMPEGNPQGNFEEEMVEEWKQNPHKGYQHTYTRPGLNLIKYPYNSNVFPIDHPKMVEKAARRRNFYPSQGVAYQNKLKAAQQQRAADEATANRYLKGLATADSVAAAEPGGGAYVEAAEHFEGMVAQEQSASEAGPSTNDGSAAA